MANSPPIPDFGWDQENNVSPLERLEISTSQCLGSRRCWSFFGSKTSTRSLIQHFLPISSSECDLRPHSDSSLSNWQRRNYDGVSPVWLRKSRCFFMPIRVTCSCGHALSVPDAYAGKSGKCPKCAQTIKIPSLDSAAKSPSAKTPNLRPAITKEAPSPKPTASSSGALDQLFADAGIGKKTGPVCPSCQAPVKPGTVICVACGFNLQAGQKLQGHTLKEVADRGPFNHSALNEADKSLKKESADDEALKFVGAPWWVYLAFVFGIIMLIAFGVIIRDGSYVDESGNQVRAPIDTFKGQVQRLPFLGALLVISLSISTMVSIMASLATQIEAFKEKLLQGFLCLFIPGYLYYYAISRRKKIWKTSFILLLWSFIAIVLTVLTMVYFMNYVPPPEDQSFTT
jgi:hypothetical protein